MMRIGSGHSNRYDSGYRWSSMMVLAMMIMISLVSSVSAEVTQSSVSQDNDNGLCVANGLLPYPSRPLPSLPANALSSVAICWLSFNGSVSISSLVSHGITKTSSYIGIGVALINDKSRPGYYSPMMIASDFNGATNDGRQKDFRPDHAVPLGSAINCDNANDDASVVSTIDLSNTEFVVDPSHSLSIWNTFGASSIASTSSKNGVEASKEWPHWHSISITANGKTSASISLPSSISSLASSSCSIRAPMSVMKAGNNKESMAMGDAAMNTWNGGYLIPIVRLLRLGESSNTVSTSRSLLPSGDKSSVGIRETKYNGVVIATSTKDDRTIMIISSLSTIWSTSTSNEAAIPIGHAIECRHDDKGMTESIIDLSSTSWRVDTINTKWSFINTDEKNPSAASSSDDSTTSMVDITNPSRIVVIAKGGCSSMTVTGEFDGHIVIQPSLSAELFTFCQMVGLAEYPQSAIYGKPATPSGYNDVCWLSLGTADVQRTSSQARTAGGTKTTTFTGIGVAIGGGPRSSWKLTVLTNDFNGATSTGTQDHYTSQIAVPFGAAFSCSNTLPATSYIDLRQTEFVVDRQGLDFTTANIFTACSGISAAAATLSTVWPYWDDITVTASGTSAGACGSMAANMIVTTGTCDTNAWNGGIPNNEVRLLRLIRLGNSLSKSEANTINAKYTSTYPGVVMITSSGAPYTRNIRGYETMYYAVGSGTRAYTPQHEVPFGTAFACGSTTVSNSIVDLRNTGWSVDTKAVGWVRRGAGNTGGVDQSNPQLIYITATSSATGSTCDAPAGSAAGFTSTTANGDDSWAGLVWNIPIVWTLNHPILCKAAGLVDYPDDFAIRPRVAPGAQLCWLNLGTYSDTQSSTTQRTRSHLTNGAGQDLKTTYNGVGVSVAPSTTQLQPYYEINIIANDFNGIQSNTGSQTHYLLPANQPGVPIGSAFSCNVQATTYIDLRLTNFIIDNTATNWLACASGTGSATWVAPWTQDWTITSNGGCAWNSPQPSCDEQGAWVGVYNIRLLRVIKFGGARGTSYSQSNVVGFMGTLQNYQNTYEGAVIATAYPIPLNGQYTTLIVTDKTGIIMSQNQQGATMLWTPIHAVPLGAAFACSTVATSVIDLTQSGGWIFDLTKVGWFLGGSGNTGTISATLNKVTITANSGFIEQGCVAPTTQGAITSVLRNPGTDAWASAVTYSAATVIPVFYGGSDPNQPALCAQTCANGGACNGWNRCQCASGWGGDTCTEYVGTCSPSTCTNGFCNAGTCQCYPTWSKPSGGNDCTVRVCTPTCQNGATCNSATGTCSCTSGWTGLDCTIGVCPTCANGGECTNGGLVNTAATCTCLVGSPFTGATCSQVNCAASPAPCKNGATCSNSICSCASGWSGALCDQPVCTTSCGANTQCLTPPQCVCLSGYARDGSGACQPVCSPTCGAHGTCIGPNQCQCAQGYIGAACDQQVCTVPCLSGTCPSSPTTCVCNSGFSGAQCDTPVCSPSANCNGHGVCTPPADGTTGSNTCVCADGWSGSACSTPLCPAGCLNGGTCVSAYTCGNCQNGYTGPTCAVRRTCSVSCVHGGCGADGLCSCEAGWSGASCTTPICVKPCQNGGTCSGPEVCTGCATGYTGDHCELPACPGCNLANGVCTAPGVCQCINGWQPANDCSKPVCGSDNNGCRNGGTCSAPYTCTNCPAGFSGSACEIASCTAGLCSSHGTCNTAATTINQCICDQWWSSSSTLVGAPQCETSAADVQDLFVLSTGTTFGVEVVSPWEQFAQQVPLKDSTYAAALAQGSKLLRAWNGGLLSIVADSLYLVNPYTGTSQVLTLGHRVASGAVAIALTEVDNYMYMLRANSLYYMGADTAYAPMLWGPSGQWLDSTTMVATYDEIYIAGKDGLSSADIWGTAGVKQLMVNTAWAINARFLTSIGSLIFGFDQAGYLWSYDTLLHVSRDYQLPDPFASITGLTSDGTRLVFVSNGKIMATTTDLLSLVPIAFETFEFDSGVTFNQVTAMTWLQGLAHIVNNGQLYMVSVDAGQTLDDTFVLNPLTGVRPTQASTMTEDSLCFIPDQNVPNFGGVTCVNIRTGVMTQTWNLAGAWGYGRSLVYAPSFDGTLNRYMYGTNGGGTMLRIDLNLQSNQPYVQQGTNSFWWVDGANAVPITAGRPISTGVNKWYTPMYAIAPNGRLCLVKLGVNDNTDCTQIGTKMYSYFTVKAITSILDHVYIAAENNIYRVSIDMNDGTYGQAVVLAGNWATNVIVSMTNINGFLYVMDTTGTLREVSRQPSYPSVRVVGVTGEWANQGVLAIKALSDRSLWYDIGMKFVYGFTSTSYTSGSTEQTSTGEISRSIPYMIDAKAAFTCFAYNPTEIYLKMTLEDVSIKIDSDPDPIPQQFVLTQLYTNVSMVVVQSRTGQVLHVYGHVNESTEAVNLKRAIASLLNTYTGVQTEVITGEPSSAGHVDINDLKNRLSVDEVDATGSYRAYYSMDRSHEVDSVGGYRLRRIKHDFDHYHPNAQARVRVNAVHQHGQDGEWRDATTTNGDAGAADAQLSDTGDEEWSVDRYDDCTTVIRGGLIRSRTCAINARILNNGQPLPDPQPEYANTQQEVGGSSTLTFTLGSIVALGCHEPSSETYHQCFHDMAGYQRHRIEFEPVTSSSSSSSNVDDAAAYSSSSISPLVRRIATSHGCYDRHSCTRLMPDIMPLLRATDTKYGTSSQLIRDLSFIASGGLQQLSGVRVDTSLVYKTVLSAMISHGSEVTQEALIHEFNNRHVSHGSLESRQHILLGFPYLTQPSVSWSKTLIEAYHNGLSTAALSLGLLVDRTGHQSSRQFLYDQHSKAMNQIISGDSKVNVLTHALANIAVHDNWLWLHSASSSSLLPLRETCQQLLERYGINSNGVASSDTPTEVMTIAAKLKVSLHVGSLNNSNSVAGPLPSFTPIGNTYTKSVGNSYAGIELNAKYSLEASIDQYGTFEAKTDNQAHLKAHVFDYNLNILDAVALFDVRSMANGISLVLGQGTKFAKTIFKVDLPCPACYLQCRGPSGSLGSGAREVFSFDKTILVGPIPIVVKVGLFAGYNFNYQLQFCALNRPPSFLAGFGASASVYARASAGASIGVIRGGASVDLSIFDGNLEPRATLNLKEMCGKIDFSLSALSGHVDAWWQTRGCGPWYHFGADWCDEHRYKLLSWNGPAVTISWPSNPCISILGLPAPAEPASLSRESRRLVWSTPENPVAIGSVHSPVPNPTDNTECLHFTNKGCFGNDGKAVKGESAFTIEQDKTQRIPIRSYYMAQIQPNVAEPDKAHGVLVDSPATTAWADYQASQTDWSNSPLFWRDAKDNAENLRQYNKGHLAPKADFKGSQEGVYPYTTTYVNMVPQLHLMNAGYWADLEGRVRTMIGRKDAKGALSFGAANPLHVVTGTCGKTKTLDNAGGARSPAVPYWIWKVVCTKDPENPAQYKAIGFVHDNRANAVIDITILQGNVASNQPTDGANNRRGCTTTPFDVFNGINPQVPDAATVAGCNAAAARAADNIFWTRYLL